MQERVFNTSNIEVMFHHELIGISGEQVVQKRRLSIIKPKKKKERS